MNKNLIIALNAIEQKHDVELALVDDFINESEQIIELSKKDVQKVLDALNSAKFQIEVLNEVPKRSLALLNKYKDLEVKAKELGITLPNNLQNTVKQLQPLTRINISKLDGLIKSVVTELNKQ
jgi:hypothetical protein